MDVIPEVNKIYRVNHVRKGSFVMGVTAVRGDFIDGIILEGRAHYISDENNLRGRGYEGDTVTVRTSLCTFEEYNEPD